VFDIILVGILVGVLCGTFTGLIPGIHTNLIASLLPVVVGGSLRPSWTAVFLISMGVTHTVTSILPNVYLGVCEGDDVVNVLPAHQLVIEGRGGDAVLANVFGGCVAACVGALYFSVVAHGVSVVYPVVSSYLPFLLGGVLVYLVMRGSSLRRSAIIVALSGGLGWAVLQSPLRDALFPLLSGLFGVPLLVASNGGSVRVDEHGEGVNVGCCRSGLIGSSLGLLTSMLPGVGSGVAASVGARFVPDVPETYLGLTGAVDTADFYLSLATLWAVEKARNGVVVVMDQMMGSVGFAVLLVVGVVAVGLGGVVTLSLQPWIPVVFEHVPYQWVSFGVVVFLAGLTVVLSGVRGFAVFCVASLLGMVTHRWGVPKISMMACIVFPVLVFLA
jgi:putative membrane protein